MEHVADFTKVSASTPNKYNSVLGKPETCINRYTHSMTLAPHRFHATSDSW